jgi:hypothetical protein
MLTSVSIHIIYNTLLLSKNKNNTSINKVNLMEADVNPIRNSGMAIFFILKFKN